MSTSSLVLGGGGFIGGHLSRELKNRGDHVVTADVKPLEEWHQRVGDLQVEEFDVGDPGNFDFLKSLSHDAERVFILAADMGGMGFIETNKLACMLTTRTTTAALVAAMEAEVPDVFYASSACVYPSYRQDEAQIPGLKERDAYPADPEDGYGWEKLFGERLCGHITEETSTTCHVARYHNVYGDLGTYDGGREKAPAAICRKVAQAVLSGDHTIDIWGDGEQTRSFMYVDDCVEGTIRLIESDVIEPINLGSDRMVTINELVTIVEGIAGVRLERRYIDGPLGVRGRNSDNELIEQHLGWSPSIALEDGLARTYRWVYDELTGA
jgi:nucleoside-diphosphate-sugar epimerase